MIPVARWIGNLLVVCALLVLPAGPAEAQRPASETAQATSTDVAITGDGVLEEPAWSMAVPITGFVQRDAQEGELASEQAEIRIADSSYGRGGDCSA